MESWRCSSRQTPDTPCKNIFFCPCKVIVSSSNCHHMDISEQFFPALSGYLSPLSLLLKRVSCTILYVSLVVILNKGVFPTFYLQDPKYSIEKSKIVHECFRVYIITILFHTYYTKRCLLHLSDIFKNGNCTLLPGKWFLHHSTCISQILLNVL